MKLRFLFCFFIQLCWILPVQLEAQQQFSEWSVDPAVKTLKARYMHYKATDGYYWIKLEISSSVSCRMQVTSTLCNNDKNDRNGWKSITLTPNTPKIIGFRVLNSCMNGWWWWYRAYNQIIYTY